jgi:hypothetical protein
MELSTKNFEIFRSTVIQRILIILLTLIWAPLLFLNFDSHHDGLMLTTINSLRAALTGGQDWPFNQYGSFWAFPYVMFSYLFPSSMTFFSMRLLAVLCYLLSGYLLFRLAKFLGYERIGYWALIAFLGSQPYVSDFGSDLVPWPSSIAMPLVLLLTFQTIKIARSPVNFLRVSAFLSGLLIALIALTRFQIGIALFIFIATYFMVFFKSNARWFLPLGFFPSIAFFSAFLYSRDWLNDSLFDGIIFASRYVRGDKSTYPSPIFTFMGTFLFVVILFFTPRLIVFLKDNKFVGKSISIFIGILILMFSGSLIFLNKRGLNLTDTITTISRRTWICITLATLIFASFRQLYRTVNLLIRKEVISNEVHALNLLIGIACIAQLQVWPLFDQMHFWWGSVPSFLVMVFIINEQKDSAGLSFRVITVGRSLVYFAVISAAFIPWVTQVSQSKDPFIPQYIAMVNVSSSQAQNQYLLQEFFHSNLEKDESILNFCDNTDVFFDGNFVRSASRIFLLWPGFKEVDEYRNSFTSAKFSSVVTCSLVQMPTYRKTSERDQNLLLQGFKPKLYLVASFKENGGRTWEIWKPAT